MRLFIAVNLPADERQRLSSLLARLAQIAPDVRWVPADSLHITLKFLGEVAADDVAALCAALHDAAAGVAPFRLELRDFGAFPSPSRPQVFWIGIHAASALMKLQERVERATEPLGYAREARGYMPHLTVGRTRKDARIDRAQMDRLSEQAVYNSVIDVASVELMRSHLGPRAARYEVLETAGLA